MTEFKAILAQDFSFPDFGKAGYPEKITTEKGGFARSRKRSGSRGHGSCKFKYTRKGLCMLSGEAEKRSITVRLNQQQLELVDRTIARGLAENREDLMRLALREYAANREGKADE
ncbi:ribbon-helix-helix domain-containing protein [uncultured Roseibium sp.]|uniref:ribbon-helix-helix domain-containing protein n=1 Tax=uncultured Roseibium sp. TaxID=1936171 RepID=UPI00260C9F71|nr:ribbon-helix-helix domain-containing protein [uncultured Roseibium sp.]